MTTVVSVITKRLYCASTVFAAVILGAALAAAPTSSWAAVRISGSVEAVRVEAQDTSIAQILTALGHDFNVQYTGAANLDRELTGTYQGSLRHVLTRVLEGYNFIIKARENGIEITVLGTQTGSGAAVAAAPPPVAKTAPVVSATAPPPPKAAAAAQTIAKPEPAVPPVKVAQQPAGPAGDALAVGSALAAATPEIKLAEGPMPTPSASSSSLTPGAPVGSAPMVQPAVGSAPMPSAATGASPGPEPAPAPSAAPSKGPDTTTPAGKPQ